MKLADIELETLWYELANVPFDDDEGEMITVEKFHPHHHQKEHLMMMRVK